MFGSKMFGLWGLPGWRMTEQSQESRLLKRAVYVKRGMQG